MVSFHYTRKDREHRLPHSQVFETLTKHTRRHSNPATQHQSSPQTQEDLYAPSGATADLDTYTASMRTWTLDLFHTAFPTVPHRLSRHQYSYTTFSHTPTIVSPLYPKDSLLYSNITPRVDSGDVEQEVLGDIGTTPCNTPKNRGLKRRSTVVAAKGGRVRDEVADEGEGQARLRPMELTRSLSCAG